VEVPTKKLREPLSETQLRNLTADEFARLKLTDEEKARLRAINEARAQERAMSRSLLNA
jgi:phage FluMu protein gp41